MEQTRKNIIIKFLLNSLPKTKVKLGKFTMVSQPIDLGRLVVSSSSIVLILFDTLIDVRLRLHHKKGGWGEGGQVTLFFIPFLLVGSK